MANEMNTTQPNSPAPQAPVPPAVPPASKNASERFTKMVMHQFGGSVGAPALTEFQQRLIQGYFIAVDRALKAAEDERLRKNKNNRDHKFDNDLPVTWENINLTDLALDVVHYARMGLDMMQDNHLFPIPYKNNKLKKYDVTLMPGYNGIRYIAEKYAVEAPVAVATELVYSTDSFRPIKKNRENRVESYEFTINQPFERGDVVGGFGYIEYSDATRNELIIMSLKDILKRKPAYASANFWGGKQKVWENGTQVEKEVEGWFDEMCLKTLIREVYSAKHIPRDPQKIDDSYQYMKYREAQAAEMQVREDIDAYANGEIIDTTPELPPREAATLPPTAESYPVNRNTGEVIEPAAEPQQAEEAPMQYPDEPPELPVQEYPDGQQTMLGGPDF